MFEVLESVRASLNAPWHIILSCPIGLIVAMHFGRQKRAFTYTPDTSASLAKSAVIVRSNVEWLRKLCCYLGLLLAGLSFLYILDPVRASSFIEMAFDKVFFLNR